MKLREQMPVLDGATEWFNSDSVKKDIGNKPTFLHFWSVSCSLCKQAMPYVNKLYKEYKDDLNVIAVHMPRSEQDMDLVQIKRVVNDHNMYQPILVDQDHKVADAFDNRYVPAYYVFDVNSKLRHFQKGSGGMKMLEHRINRLLSSTGKK